MPRRLRSFLDGCPVHVVQRGNNRQHVFLRPEHFIRFRTTLRESAAQAGCAIHAYVLMSNHIHLLLTPSHASSLPRIMQSIGRRYVSWFNRVENRTGTLWEGRYRASVIDSDAYLLSCHRYIELNPVRAGMVSRPSEYPWSSFAENVLGIDRGFVEPHPIYLALGNTPEARRAAYLQLFAEKLDERFLLSIRDATARGAALGDPAFQRWILAQKQVPNPDGSQPAAARRRPDPSLPIEGSHRYSERGQTRISR